MSSYTPLVSTILSGDDANDTAYLHNPGPTKVMIKRAWIVPEVAVTAHNDNHITVDVLKSATSIVTPIHTDANAASPGASWVAGTPIEFTVSPSGGTNLVLGVNEKWTITVTKAGTGPAYGFAVSAQCIEVR